MAVCYQGTAGDALAQRAKKKPKNAAAAERAEAGAGEGRVAAGDYGGLKAVLAKHLEGPGEFDVSDFVGETRKALYEKNPGASILLRSECSLVGESGECIVYRFFDRCNKAMPFKPSARNPKARAAEIAAFVPEVSALADFNAFESEFMGLKGYQIIGGTGENAVDALCYQISTNSVLAASAFMKKGGKAAPKIISEAAVYRYAVDSACNWRDSGHFSFFRLEGLKTLSAGASPGGADSVTRLGVEGAAAQIVIYAFAGPAAAEKAFKNLQADEKFTCRLRGRYVVSVPAALKN